MSSSSTSFSAMFKNLSDQEVDELVTNYVRNAMSSEGRENFEIELLDNPFLAEKVEKEMQMQLGFTQLSSPVTQRVQANKPKLIAASLKNFFQQPWLGGALAAYSVVATIALGAILVTPTKTNDDQLDVLGFSTAVTRSTPNYPTVMIDDSQANKAISFKLSDSALDQAGKFYLELEHKPANTVWKSTIFERTRMNIYSILLPRSLAQGQHSLQVIGIDETGETQAVSFCHYLEKICN